MMNKVKSLSVALLLLLVSACATDDDGWVELFNGKDLTGWRQVSGSATYEVINGELVGTSVDDMPSSRFLEVSPADLKPSEFPRNSFLATEKRYSDFIFEVDLFAGDMNGGIQFRSNIDPDYWHGLVHGYQAEVDPSERAWSAGIYDEMRRGWLYPGTFNPKARQAFKANEWNRYRIESIGNSLRTWLNGIPVAHVIDNMSPQGFIALQVHFIMSPEEIGQQIRWKNIRIKTENLTTAPADDIFIANYLPDNLSEAERGQGWRLLGDSDLTEHGGDKRTAESYEAFDFQFEFKANEGATGGIRYFADKNNSGLGHEYLILPDIDANGAKKTGSLSGLISAKEVRKHPGAFFEREWNRGRIVALPGGKVEHWLNGTLVLAYMLDSDKFKALVSSSEYAGESGFGMANDSPIVIRGQNGAVQFRSLKMKKLN